MKPACNDQLIYIMVSKRQNVIATTPKKRESQFIMSFAIIQVLWLTYVQNAISKGIRLHHKMSNENNRLFTTRFCEVLK